MILADEAATATLGARLAALLRTGDVIALSGDLGAGKTTLARGMLGGLGLAGAAPSPTFAIVIPYAPPETRWRVAHVDLYRIEDPADAGRLGLDEHRAEGALIVEWPERLGEARWRDALRLHLAVRADGARVLTADAPAAWGTRWPPR